MRIIVLGRFLVFFFFFTAKCLRRLGYLIKLYTSVSRLIRKAQLIMVQSQRDLRKERRQEGTAEKGKKAGRQVEGKREGGTEGGSERQAEGKTDR